MSFTVATGAVLHLGGASQTAPTLKLSGGLSGATSFLVNGIPLALDKLSFADIAKGEPNGHSIKHALIEIISGATPGTPNARTMQDGSTPTATLGRQRSVGDVLEFHNSASSIFNFKLLNNGGGNMIVEVEVFE